MIRAFWVLRAFVLRAGELTGQGAALFFLPIDEILAVLGGDDRPLASIPARRAAHQRYSALPTYPTLIRGRFDPFRWAADPHRRSDVDDEHGVGEPVREAITGFPGAAGVVEGTARVLATVDDGDILRPGEILVTTVTNIGWTPLFPRAAAVVTDIGAPLSHAAIVARAGNPGGGRLRQRHDAHPQRRPHPRGRRARHGGAAGAGDGRRVAPLDRLGPRRPG